MSGFEIIAAAIVIAALSVPLLLMFFKILFRLYHGKHRKLAYILAPGFVICDFLVNTYSISILFLEPPKAGEWLVTARLKRWKKIPADSKGRFKRRRDYAFKMCAELNTYDEGHC